MKLFGLTLKMLLSISIIIFCINFNQGCKDPKDYAPPEDSLVPPPDETPELLFPPDDTHFVFGQNGHGWDTIWVNFKWTAVTDAQYYELEISTDPKFPEGMSSTYKSYSTSHTLALGVMDCHWHVRAGNRYWTWFADWSETGNFQLVYPPLE